MEQPQPSTIKLYKIPPTYPWKMGPRMFHQQFMFRNSFRIVFFFGGGSLGYISSPGYYVGKIIDKPNGPAWRIIPFSKCLGSPRFISHKFRPFGRCPITPFRGLCDHHGDENHLRVLREPILQVGPVPQRPEPEVLNWEAAKLLGFSGPSDPRLATAAKARRRPCVTDGFMGKSFVA